MKAAAKPLLYLGSAAVLALFAPVLDFRYLAGGVVILVGLGLIDLFQSLRRRR